MLIFRNIFNHIFMYFLPEITDYTKNQYSTFLRIKSPYKLKKENFFVQLTPIIPTAVRASSQQ